LTDKKPKVTLKKNGEVVIEKEDWRGFIATGIVAGFLVLCGGTLIWNPAAFDRVASTLGPLVGLVVGYYFRDKTKGGE